MKLENVSDVYPLTPMQEGMLFHTVAEPTSGVYVDQAVVTLIGDLDAHRFSDCIQSVFSRFDALRTAFIWDGVDQPLQVVREEVNFPIEILDWQNLNESQNRDQLLALISEQSSKGFELERAPLVRAILCQYSTEQWRLVIVFHHLVLDGWSTHSLIGQLLEAYESKVPSQQQEFPFRRYIEWVISQDQDAAADFWKQELAGFQSCNEIGPPKPVQGEDSKSQHQIFLSADQSQQLRKFARQNRVTLNTVMQAAWSVLVSRYAGGDSDVVFGTTVAGRPMELNGIESGIGSFINTIPFRTKLDPDKSLAQWLHEIQSSQAGYRQWEFTSLVKAQKQADIPPGASLFESILVFENYPATDRTVGKLSIGGIEHFETSNYPLAFLVVPTHEIKLVLIADSNRYPSTVIEKMLTYLEFVLAEFVADAEVSLGQVLNRLPSDQQESLAEWNKVLARPADEEIGIEHLIQQTVSNYSNETAVAFGSDRITYAELDQRSSQVTRVLMQAGVRPNQPVALCVERSLEMIVGIVAILKAGGYYVPLDTIYPQAHIHHVLEDADIKVVLTNKSHGKLVSSKERKLVFFDELPGDIESTEISPIRSSNRLAYAIYTSGSTGKPKGVMITHQNLIHSTTARSVYYDKDPQSYLLMSSIAFDSSVAGIFWTLLSGGKLVVPEPDAEQDLAGLIELIQTEQVTHLLCLPVLYQLLLEASQSTQLASLQVAIVAGEAVSTEVARAHYATNPSSQLHNEYGPTEGTVWATAHQVSARDAESNIPIGKPIQNVGAILIDQNGCQVPFGAVGEIYLTGQGVAAGYLNRPELTSEKFVDAFDYEGQLVPMYRTGDLGYFSDGGVLTFCGRADSQVKIRGYRIELGEIETAIVAFEDVDEVAVVAQRSTDNGPLRLAAFISGNAVADRSSWFERLSGQLPEFMMPDSFVKLDPLPRLPNGKIDRGSLPSLVGERATEPFVLPRNSVETKLAEIWSATIGCGQVGIHDNFFSLGGDSIISIQVISRAHREGILIQPRDIANYPTVAQLAERAQTEVPYETAETPTTDGFPLSPIQNWFFQLELAKPNHWNLSQLFEVAEGCNWKVLTEALEIAVASHPMLQARFGQDKTGWQQRISPDPTSVVIEVFDSDPSKPESVKAVLEDLQSSIDIERGPVFRIARIVNSAGGHDQLLFAVHHLVIDLVSWRILIDDIEYSYQQLTSGNEATVPPESSSYAAWTGQLSDLATSPGIIGQLEYWREASNTTSDLPADFETNTNGTLATSTTVSRSLDEALTNSVRKDANQAYNTDTMDLLLASLGLTIAEWTGQSSLSIELEGHGRDLSVARLDNSRTVGWFTSTYPARFNVDTANVGDTIRIVKEYRRQIPDEGIGYGLLRFLNTETAKVVKQLPSPELLFNYLGVVNSGGDQQILRPLPGITPASRSSENQRTHALEVVALVENQTLTVHWKFSQELFKTETISMLADTFEQKLRTILLHCQQQEASYTPSDFPESGLNQDELDSFLDEFD